MAKLDEVASMALLLTIVVLVSYQILARWLGITATWTAEVSQIMNVWLVFLLFARAALDDRHIKIEYFVDKLPNRIRTWILPVIQIVNALTGLIVAVACIQMMRAFAGTTTEAANVPVPLVFLAGALGMAAFAVVSLYKAIRFDEDDAAVKHGVGPTE